MLAPFQRCFFKARSDVEVRYEELQESFALERRILRPREFIDKKLICTWKEIYIQDGRCDRCGLLEDCHCLVYGLLFGQCLGS